jgi:hypothetical protein
MTEQQFSIIYVALREADADLQGRIDRETMQWITTDANVTAAKRSRASIDRALTVLRLMMDAAVPH